MRMAQHFYREVCWNQECAYYILDSLYTYLCIPLVHLNTTLFFTLPSLHPPYLVRHQNGSQQRTVARTRWPSPEPNDRRTRRQPFERPASEHYERFNPVLLSAFNISIRPYWYWYWILNTCQAFIQIWGADCAFEPCVQSVHLTKASTQINTTSFYCPSLLPPRLSIYLILLLYTIPTAINKLVTLIKAIK